jgi:hypothetical protein
MLTISKSLSAGQARTYHACEFVSEEQNYWSRDAQVRSEWQGSLAQEWGLRGSVRAEEFSRLRTSQAPTCKDLRERVRQGNHERRTSRRVGCDILCAEIRLSVRACGRR